MRKTVALPQGTVDVRDTGGPGPTLLFVHGLLVNGRLWDATVDLLGEGFRCVVPNLPMGSHDRPLHPEADLTPPGLARLVSDLIDDMDLNDVTLIGNDTGGAICQVLVTQYPAKIGRLVLTNCDAYENFLPPVFRPLQWMGHVPGFALVSAQVFRARAAQRMFLSMVAHAKVSREMLDSFARPFIERSDIRRDAVKVLKGISKSYTLKAVERFGHFDNPVLIAWGTDDRFFKPKYAERLVADFPNAQLRWIAGSRTFVPLDKPAALAEAIKAFVI